MGWSVFGCLFLTFIIPLVLTSHSAQYFIWLNNITFSCKTSNTKDILLKHWTFHFSTQHLYKTSQVFNAQKSKILVKKFVKTDTVLNMIEVHNYKKLILEEFFNSKCFWQCTLLIRVILGKKLNLLFLVLNCSLGHKN